MREIKKEIVLSVKNAAKMFDTLLPPENLPQRNNTLQKSPEVAQKPTIPSLTHTHFISVQSMVTLIRFTNHHYHWLPLLLPVLTTTYYLTSNRLLNVVGVGSVVASCWLSRMSAAYLADLAMMW